ncbi:MAG: DUF1501 domain-containing protein, partial [Pirellulales bacterium]|nr:DUF1501 domain-containing protein [Pirellulales bacterium]
MNEQITRRDYLKATSAAAATAWLSTPRMSLAAKSTNDLLPATADTVIVLWMAGGMAAPDTFDPKHYEPFKVGLEAKRI